MKAVHTVSRKQLLKVLKMITDETKRATLLNVSFSGEVEATVFMTNDGFQSVETGKKRLYLSIDLHKKPKKRKTKK